MKRKEISKSSEKQRTHQEDRELHTKIGTSPEGIPDNTKLSNYVELPGNKLTDR